MLHTYCITLYITFLTRLGPALRTPICQIYGLWDSGRVNQDVKNMCWIFFFSVRLSLLTMTNPNQLCDVLLFVCSKMADETNLSSKLPVADRTREV